MILLLPGPTPSHARLCLVNRPDVPVEGPHRGELVAAAVTGGVAGVVFLVAREGLGVVEHLGADITDIFCWVTVLKTKPYNMETVIVIQSLYLVFYKSIISQSGLSLSFTRSSPTTLHFVPVF